MSGGILFITGTIIILLVVLGVVFKSPKRLRNYMRSQDGDGVKAGILKFVGLAIVVVFMGTLISKAASEPVKYFQFVDVYIGIDSPRSPSPFCASSGESDRLTSNGGLKVNLVESADDRFQANWKYTHHSCALNRDISTYDAFYGLELVYRLWSR